MRKISIRSGHRETFWKRNCVAVGLAAGFLEPLEASAIVLIELSAKLIAEQMPACREVMDIIAARFNATTHYRWGRIIDFLKLHYVLTKRTDSAFWRDNVLPETIPERLQELLLLWRYQSPWFHDEFDRIEEVFPAASYQYVLYGMGFRTEVEPDGAGRRCAAGRARMRENNMFDRTLRTGLPRHRDLIQQDRGARTAAGVTAAATSSGAGSAPGLAGRSGSLRACSSLSGVSIDLLNRRNRSHRTHRQRVVGEDFMKSRVMASVAFALSFSMPAEAAETKRAAFGTLADGRPVEAVTLTNSKGMSATVINYGAILQSVLVPDRDGKVADVTLGYSDMTSYIKAPNYFGATVGRYANRIRAGKFMIDGKAYSLAINNRPNALHGGPTGFDKRLWTIEKVANGRSASVTMRYVSADGEEGYPGTLTVSATYSLNENNELTVEYGATTDKPTIVNITNHSFFNLAGEGAPTGIYDHVMTIPAETITPVDATLIPTGELKPVAGTPFDFRTPTVVGTRIRDTSDQQIVYGNGYDHNFVIGRNVSVAPRLNVRLADPKTGRVLEVLSNQPGVQVYTGNFLNGSAIGRSGQAYRRGHGIAMEPQLFPDTPNQPAFGSARLDPGRRYRNVIVYRFSTMRSAANAN